MRKDLAQPLNQPESGAEAEGEGQDEDEQRSLSGDEEGSDRNSAQDEEGAAGRAVSDVHRVASNDPSLGAWQDLGELPCPSRLTDAVCGQHHVFDEDKDAVRRS